MMMSRETDTTRYAVTRRQAIATIAAGSTVAVAGCGVLGGGDEDTTIVASGSNTVAPITQEAAENFENDYDGEVSVEVDPQGTGAGFAEFCIGNSDIQSASRAILDDEQATCDENDVEAVDFSIGQDTLAVGVHADADWVDQITLDELNQIWDFESDVEMWSDVREEWPDEEMFLHGRDDASGTFDYFTRAINGEVARIRDGYSATSQTDEIWDAVSDNELALGWGGVGHMNEQLAEGAELKPLEVESDHPDFEGEFFPPEERYIEEGQYSPLARPLFFFVNTASLEERPTLIGDFARYYINNQLDFAPAVGFFAAPPEWVPENHDVLDATLEDLGIADELTIERQDP